MKASKYLNNDDTNDDNSNDNTDTSYPAYENNDDESLSLLWHIIKHSAPFPPARCAKLFNGFISLLILVCPLIVCCICFTSMLYLFFTKTCQCVFLVRVTLVLILKFTRKVAIARFDVTMATDRMTGMNRRRKFKILNLAAPRDKNMILNFASKVSTARSHGPCLWHCHQHSLRQSHRHRHWHWHRALPLAMI